MPETVRRSYRIDPPSQAGESPTVTVIEEPQQTPEVGIRNVRTDTTYDVTNMVTDLGSDMWGTLSDLRLSTAQLHNEVAGQEVANLLVEEANTFTELPSWSWERDDEVARGGIPEGGVIEAPRRLRNNIAVQEGDDVPEIRPARVRTFSGTARIREVEVDLGGEPIPNNVDRRCIVRPDRKTGVESWKTE